jgi:hypothetical protein
MEVAMRTMALGRRRFLLSTAAIGAAGVMAGASKVLALSVEPMDTKTEALYLSACQAPGAPNSYHQQLIADITAALQGKGEPKAEIDAQLAAAICPICGCPIS